MKKYLVIHMVKNSQGIAYNKICGVFDLPQDAEVYKDKYDRRMLDSYMVTATLDLDEKGRFVPQSFEYNEDEPTDEKTILGAMNAYSNIDKDLSLEEAFNAMPTKHEEALSSLNEEIREAMEETGENINYQAPDLLGDQLKRYEEETGNEFLPASSPEEEILRNDPQGIKDEMTELK